MGHLLGRGSTWVTSECICMCMNKWVYNYFIVSNKLIRGKEYFDILTFQFLVSSQLSSVGVSRNRAKCWTWKWNWDRKASVPVTVTGQYSLVGRHVIRADENFNSRQMKESSAEGRSLAGVKVNMKLLSWPTYSSNREHAVMRWETGVSWTHGDTAQRAIKGLLLSI